MRFETTGADPVDFDIPDDWWAFADMAGFKRRSEFYPPSGTFDRVKLAAVEPPKRSQGLQLFRKYKLMPVLFAFQSPECALPPISLQLRERPGHYAYRVHNGFHRFYASAAVGYPLLPATIHPAHDI